MSSVRHGAQWASSPQSTHSLESPTDSRAPSPDSASPVTRPPIPSSRTRRRSRTSTAAALSIGLVVALLLTVAAWSTTASAAGGYILMPRSELLARPMSGTAWANLKSDVANGASAAPTRATSTPIIICARWPPPWSSLAPGPPHTARRLAPA